MNKTTKAPKAPKAPTAKRSHHKGGNAQSDTLLQPPAMSLFSPTVLFAFQENIGKRQKKKEEDKKMTRIVRLQRQEAKMFNEINSIRQFGRRVRLAEGDDSTSDFIKRKNSKDSYFVGDNLQNLETHKILNVFQNFADKAYTSTIPLIEKYGNGVKFNISIEVEF